MKYIAIWLIKFYQRCLSPLKRRPCCRFMPTCSAYALEAFQKRGFFVGLALTVWRVLRCNPFCAGGYDPVPEHGFTNKKRNHKSAVRLSQQDIYECECDDTCMHLHGCDECDIPTGGTDKKENK